MCDIGKMFPLDDARLKRFIELLPPTTIARERERWKVHGVDIVLLEYSGDGDHSSPLVIICPCDVVCSVSDTCRARDAVFSLKRAQVHRTYREAKGLIGISEMITDVLLRVADGEFLGQDEDTGSDIVTLATLCAILPFSKSEVMNALLDLEERLRVLIIPRDEREPIITLGIVA